jgi:hypothetical protein
MGEVKRPNACGVWVRCPTDERMIYRVYRP